MQAVVWVPNLASLSSSASTDVLDASTTAGVRIAGLHNSEWLRDAVTGGAICRSPRTENFPFFSGAAGDGNSGKWNP